MHSCRKKINSGSTEACPSPEEADAGVLYQVFTNQSPSPEEASEVPVAPSQAPGLACSAQRQFPVKV